MSDIHEQEKMLLRNIYIEASNCYTTRDEEGWRIHDAGLEAVAAHARATDGAYTQDLICTLRCERDEALEELEKLEAVKKQLVEALHLVLALAYDHYTYSFACIDFESNPIIIKCRAALRAVEEEQKL